MKNKLSDLNNYLFEQLEKINDNDLTAEELDKEIKKAESITAIADTIIRNGELQFKAAMKAAEYGVVNKEQMIFLLTGAKNE